MLLSDGRRKGEAKGRWVVTGLTCQSTWEAWPFVLDSKTKKKTEKTRAGLVSPLDLPPQCPVPTCTRKTSHLRILPENGYLPCTSAVILFLARII